MSTGTDTVEASPLIPSREHAHARRGVTTCPSPSQYCRNTGEIFTMNLFLHMGGRKNSTILREPRLASRGCPSGEEEHRNSIWRNAANVNRRSIRRPRSQNHWNSGEMS
jgi:hypothetical protein